MMWTLKMMNGSLRHLGSRCYLLGMVLGFDSGKTLGPGMARDTLFLLDIWFDALHEVIVLAWLIASVILDVLSF